MFYYTLHPTSAKTRKHVQRNFLMPTLAYLFFGYYNMKAEAALLNLKAEADKITRNLEKEFLSAIPTIISRQFKTQLTHTQGIDQMIVYLRYNDTTVLFDHIRKWRGKARPRGRSPR